ncbi:hypothetical protein ThrDRAFT_04865 [Frankia casuarinae]|nr:hypothetical protein CcI6DRAFT_01344 [Frankia sp. CcI6]EYT89522.1 hypothetical protein ThrDRAFT_04865 [Frankia casuarinae]KDA40458.1 hypothetical protein BMG523Draft_04738 [Frankia sp. BMG5.23]KEZ34234.1 hypothetical protein CEDDRAFT_04419 [Frankia sp. CeD]KFB02478.1 hypothetical protein ALLO2DRAFT_04776 [Frankia sp. Allo2]
MPPDGRADWAPNLARSSVRLSVPALGLALAPHLGAARMGSDDTNGHSMNGGRKR